MQSTQGLLHTKDGVETRLLQDAYSRLPLSQVMTVVVTLIFVGLMWPFFPPVQMTAWVAAILAGTALRYAQWTAFKRAAPAPDALGPWRNHYFVGALVTGGAWSLGPNMMMPQAGNVESVLFACTLLSVCAVAVSTQASQKAAMQAFIVAALAPALVAFWRTGGEVERTLALILVAAMAALIIVGRRSHQATRTLIETQSRMRTIIETEPECITIVDAQGRLLLMNPAGLAMIGAGSLELVVGHPVRDTVASEYRVAYDSLHKRVLAGETMQMEFETLGLKGGRRWVETHAAPMKDNGNTVLLAVTRDISERKRAEEALRESERLLKESQSIAGLGSYVLDIATGLWKSSDELDRLLGIDKVYERTVEGWAALIHPDDRANMVKYLNDEVIGQGRAFDAAYRIIRRDDGVERWVHGLGRLNFDAQMHLLTMHGSIQDITEHKRAEVAIQTAAQRLQIALEGSQISVWETDLRSDRIWLDAAWAAFLGKPPVETHTNAAELLHAVHPDDRQNVIAAAVHIQKGEISSYAVEHRVKTASGEWKWILSRGRVIERDAAGRPLRLSGTNTDIDERRRSDEKLHLAANVFTHAREGILVTAADGTIIDVNDTFSRITGYSRDEVLGRNPRILGSGRQGEEFYSAMWRELQENGHWTGELWNQRKNGEEYVEMLTISTVRDTEGKPRQYVGLFSDITASKEQQKQLEHIAHYDALTSLPNRVLLADRLHQAMAQALRRGQPLAVAYLDLDGFKVINDRHGHGAGDQLLVAIAANMKQALREGDTLSRLGGDEFVAVLLDLPDVQASAPMLARLLAAAALPVHVKDLSLEVSASLGVTFYPQAEDVDADQLLRQADQAMYQAKLSGKNRYHVFDAEQDRSVRGYHESVERIRHALTAREFVLHYQPKVNMRTGAIIGAEALIRWQHPEQGLLSPAMFLPVIEEHPLAVEIGEWVIGTALSQMTLWKAAGLDIRVSVNVGARQLQQAGFPERLRAILAAHPELRPDKLELEILETSALEDVTGVSRIIDACRDIGVTFALDDFGTGYSSLTYLKRLLVDLLKIDQSFVRDMLEDPDDLAILEGVIGLATAFHRQVMAEGVETVEHGEMLLQLGCELAQGYGIARPMPAAELSGWSSTWRPDSAWVNCPQVSRDDLPLLFASVEHRAWISAIEAFLRGEREVPPPLNPHQCNFGKWLDSQSSGHRRSQPIFQSMERLHLQVHALAAELRELQGGGGSPEVPARLAELHGLRDSLLGHMRALTHANR